MPSPHSLLIHLAHPRALWLLAALPVLSVLAGVARWRRRRRLARLGDQLALRPLVTVRRPGRLLSGWCFTLALVALAVACAGPQWGVEATPALATGRDVVVVLDLSKSMLAEDVVPNRLARAREGVLDLLETVRRRGGHRLALVAFAGRVKVVCPLTPDYDHVREAVAALDPADPELAPKPAGDEPVSGTRIGLALREAVKLHDPRFRGQQDVLLISDGDDPAQDDEWQAGVAAARDQAIPIYTVGVGSPERESGVPGPGGRPLLHDGQEVRTSLHERPLLELARRTGGEYLPARVERLPLGAWFRQRVQSEPGHESDDATLPVYHQRYAWFFGGALGLLAVSVLIGDGSRPERVKPEEVKR